MIYKNEQLYWNNLYLLIVTEINQIEMIVLKEIIRKFAYEDRLYFAKRGHLDSLIYHFSNELTSYKRSKITP